MSPATLARPAPVLEVRAAPFWRRLIGDALDLVVLAAAGLAMWRAGIITPVALPARRYDWVDFAAEVLGEHAIQLAPAAVLIPTVGVLYGTVAHTLAGRTLGELLVGLQLVAPDGRRPGPLRSVLHAVGTALGVALLLIGYVWAAVDLRRQGLAEYLSDTVLVAGRPRSRAQAPRSG